MSREQAAACPLAAAELPLIAALRHTDATNLPAKAALEYRIGRLRQRREALR